MPSSRTESQGSSSHGGGHRSHASGSGRSGRSSRAPRGDGPGSPAVSPRSASRSAGGSPRAASRFSAADLPKVTGEELSSQLLEAAVLARMRSAAASRNGSAVPSAVASSESESSSEGASAEYSSGGASSSSTSSSSIEVDGASSSSSSEDAGAGVGSGKEGKRKGDPKGTVYGDFKGGRGSSSGTATAAGLQQAFDELPLDDAVLDALSPAERAALVGGATRDPRNHYDNVPQRPTLLQSLANPFKSLFKRPVAPSGSVNELSSNNSGNGEELRMSAAAWMGSDGYTPGQFSSSVVSGDSATPNPSSSRHCVVSCGLSTMAATVPVLILSGAIFSGAVYSIVDKSMGDTLYLWLSIVGLLLGLVLCCCGVYAIATRQRNEPTALPV